jgi:hypothetical protein
MNRLRLILAGLLAGLILNIGEALLHGFIYADATTRAMHDLGHEISGSATDTALLIGITFAQGLLCMWLYHALQPHWRAGPATAIRVGLIAWVLSGVYSGVYLAAGFAGLFPASITWGPVIYEFLLYPIAIVAGSLVYKPR